MELYWATKDAESAHEALKKAKALIALVPQEVAHHSPLHTAAELLTNTVISRR